jgi:hypothetical protein
MVLRECMPPRRVGVSRCPFSSSKMGSISALRGGGSIFRTPITSASDGRFTTSTKRRIPTGDLTRNFLTVGLSMRENVVIMNPSQEAKHDHQFDERLHYHYGAISITPGMVPKQNGRGCKGEQLAANGLGYRFLPHMPPLWSDGSGLRQEVAVAGRVKGAVGHGVLHSPH